MEKFLIVDVDCPCETQGRFVEFGLSILDAQMMTDDLLAWEDWERLEPKSTLVVFPGNGASIVRKFINNENPRWLARWPHQATPFAKRVWRPGEDPRAYAERIFPQGFLLGLKSVVIIDDVISSGETIKKLRRENDPFIPGADWKAICWVAQQAASTKGFSTVFATKTVGEKNHKVPINSLSTLIEYREIAELYARRNFGEKAQAFLKIIESLR